MKITIQGMKPMELKARIDERRRCVKELRELVEIRVDPNDATGIMLKTMAATLEIRGAERLGKGVHFEGIKEWLARYG